MNNPYSAPVHGFSSLQSEGSGAVVQGNLLKVKSGFVFPENCVQCGESCFGHMKKRQLYYAPVWMWFFILLNLAVLALVYFIIRKRLDVTFGFCEKHKSKKRLYGIISIISILAGVGMAVGSVALAFPILAVATPFLVVAALVFFVLCNKTITISGHNKGEFTIKGINSVVLGIIASRNG